MDGERGTTLKRVRIIMRKWWAWLGIILATGTGAGAVHAEYRGGTIRIGVLNDQSGLYADIAGTASVWVARKAVEDSALPPRA
jgi:hypothetical protein